MECMLYFMQCPGVWTEVRQSVDLNNEDSFGLESDDELLSSPSNSHNHSNEEDQHSDTADPQETEE